MCDLNDKYKYLSILKRPLDDQQLKVCCYTDNAVVAAGAGSGKTQVLATRFAFLIMEYDDIKAASILTLTFTNKAASEMYVRIYDTLKTFAEDKSGLVPLRQKNNAIKALEDFASVHIQTLDSYCNTIVKQCANRYGITPDFMISNLEDINKRALTFLIKNLNNKGLQHFCEPGSIEEFCDEEFVPIITEHTSLATKKGYFISSLIKQKSEIIKKWNEYINPPLKVSGTITYILDQIRETAILVRENKDADKKYKEFDQLFAKLLDEDNIPDASLYLLDEKKLEDKAYLDHIKSYVESIKFLLDFKTKAKKGSITPLKAYIKELNVFFENNILSIINYIEEVPFIESLFLLFDEFLDEVNDTKRRTGSLSFRDVTDMALKILIEQKDIREQEKSAYRKIMIDEFQDNNGKNRDLLFLLSEKQGVSCDFDYDSLSSSTIHDRMQYNIEKDKLFFVGDEKQSIYKFRGADVSVFTELKEDIKRINGEDSYLHMIYNYRSSPELLTSFNSLFGSYKVTSGDYNFEGYGNFVFYKDNPMSYDAQYGEDAVARYVDKNTHMELSPVEITQDNIKSHVVLIKENETFKKNVSAGLTLKDKEQYAFYIAEKIKEIQKNDPDSSIAILEKGRKFAASLTSALEKNKIIYRVDDLGSSIFSDAVVNDIYSFLRLCVYPSDLEALSVYLCSPMAGLMAGDLENILSLWDSSYSEENINEILQYLGNDSVEALRFKGAVDFYLETRDKALSQKITETLNYLWYKKGYRYEVMLNENVSLLSEQYDFLFEVAREVDNNGNRLDWFVDQLSIEKITKNDSDIDLKDVHFPLEKGKCVEIMTIHKSKGLQFDYVFILGLFESISGDKDEKYFFDEDVGVSLKPASGEHNYFFVRQKELSSKKDEAEFRRIAYVAITRAVKEYYLVGKYSVKKDGEQSKSNEIMNNVLNYYYPSIVDDDEGLYFNADKKAPFDLEIIKPYGKEVLFNDAEKTESIDELRTQKISSLESVLEGNIKILDAAKSHDYRISPSALENIGGEDTGSTECGYTELDKIIENCQKKNIAFTYKNFGTMLHKYFENSIKGLTTEEISLQCQKFTSAVNDKDALILMDICSKMFDSFSHGKLYAQLQAVRDKEKFLRTEYGFKMYLSSYLITGSIDLCYEDEDGFYVIVDYKTDREIKAEKYYAQQSCYKKALSEIKCIEPSKIKCILYYTRYDSYIDITPYTDMELTKELFDSFKGIL